MNLLHPRPLRVDDIVKNNNPDSFFTGDTGTVIDVQSSSSLRVTIKWHPDGAIIPYTAGTGSKTLNSLTFVEAGPGSSVGADALAALNILRSNLIAERTEAQERVAVLNKKIEAVTDARRVVLNL